MDDNQYEDLLADYAPGLSDAIRVVKVSQLMFCQQVVLAPSVPRAARLIVNLAVSDLIDLLDDVSRGSGRSATRTARVLVEHLVNLCTVISDEDAAERYMAHLDKGPVLLDSLPLEPDIDSKTLKSLRRELHKASRSARPRWEAALKQYGRGFSNNWHPNNLRLRAEQFGLGKRYQYYKLASSVIHGSAAGAVGNIKQPEEEGPATYAAGLVPNLIPSAFVFGTDAYLGILSVLEDAYPEEVDATAPGTILSAFCREETVNLVKAVRQSSRTALEEQTSECILAVSRNGLAKVYLHFENMASRHWFEAVKGPEAEMLFDWLRPVVEEYFRNENHGFTNEAGLVGFKFPFSLNLHLRPARHPIPGDTMPVVTTIDGATWFRLHDQVDVFGAATNPNETGQMTGRIVRPTLDIDVLLRALDQT